jgi:hypothetical protein
VGELVEGVVVDVLRHVGVEVAQRLGEGLVACAVGQLVVLDPAQLVVLLPQIGLEDLCGRQVKTRPPSFTACEVERLSTV